MSHDGYARKIDIGEVRGPLEIMTQGAPTFDAPPVEAGHSSSPPPKRATASEELRWILEGVRDRKASVEWACQTIARFIVKLTEQVRDGQPTARVSFDLHAEIMRYCDANDVHPSNIEPLVELFDELYAMKEGERITEREKCARELEARADELDDPVNDPTPSMREAAEMYREAAETMRAAK